MNKKKNTSCRGKFKFSISLEEIAALQRRKLPLSAVVRSETRRTLMQFASANPDGLSAETAIPMSSDLPWPARCELTASI